MHVDDIVIVMILSGVFAVIGYRMPLLDYLMTAIEWIVDFLNDSNPPKPPGLPAGA